MSTVHLVYSSLQNAFNVNKFCDVSFIIRNSKIEYVLNECNLLPTVINNIIYDYANRQKIQYQCRIESDYDNYLHMHKITLSFVINATIYGDIYIYYKKKSGVITYDLIIRNHINNIIHTFNSS